MSWYEGSFVSRLPAFGFDFLLFLLQAMVAFALLLIVEGFKGGPGLVFGGGAPSGI